MTVLLWTRYLVLAALAATAALLFWLAWRDRA